MIVNESANPRCEPDVSAAGNHTARIDEAVASLSQQPIPIPRDADGPVFAEPWQAQVFAMTLQLHEQGVFEWKEWAATLSAKIEEAQQNGDPDLGDTYYHHWLNALELMVANKNLGSATELESLKMRWDNAARTTPHGQPIAIAPTK